MRPKIRFDGESWKFLRTKPDLNYKISYFFYIYLMLVPQDSHKIWKILQNLLTLFSSKIFGKMWIVPISFVFDKYCPIMN